MNLQVNSTPIQRPRRRNWILILGLVPFVILTLIAVLFAFRETVASAQLKKVVEEIRQAGEPMDDASMAKWFEKNTFKEGTEAWSEILTLVRSSSKLGVDLPFVGTGAIPTDFKPGCDWPDESRIAGFLEEFKPVIVQIQKAAEYPAPVWMPLRFDGFNTLLEEVQVARSVANLLELDAYHAMYHQDSERTLRDIQALEATSKAFDWRFCFVTNLVRTAIRNIHRRTINQSLSMNLWSEQQLTQLTEQVQHADDVRKVWKDVAIGERALTSSYIEEPTALNEFANAGPVQRFLSMIPLLPSGRLNILDECRSWMQVGEQGRPGLKERAEAWEREFAARARTVRPGAVYIGLLMPAVSGYASALDDDETLRRLTLTSIAVKKFQLSKGKWPKRLSELTEMGLGFDDWTTLDWTTLGKQSFGYTVEDEEALVLGKPIQVQGSQAYVGEDPWRVTIR